MVTLRTYTGEKVCICYTVREAKEQAKKRGMKSFAIWDEKDHLIFSQDKS